MEMVFSSKPSGGNELCLHAALRPYEEDMIVPAPQLAGDGQCGNHMATGTPTCH